MKTFVLILSLLSMVSINALAAFPVQSAKRPTLMILPSDNWCSQRYFMTTYQNQGAEVKVPNYQQAFMEDSELGQVISKVGAVLTKWGYSLKDAEQEIKSINVKMAEDNVTSSHTNNSLLSESSLDVLKRRMKSDVIIQIWWKINRAKLGHTVSFTIEAFDAYTNKRIATSTGTSKESNESVPVLLANAVEENIKPFDKQIDEWYSDQQKKGREIVLTVRCWDNWNHNLETEYNGDELTDCIQNWLQDHTVNGSFNLSDGSENFAQFEQVRIPLFSENGRAMDARTFATNLRNLSSG